MCVLAVLLLQCQSSLCLHPENGLLLLLLIVVTLFTYIATFIYMCVCVFVYWFVGFYGISTVVG